MRGELFMQIKKNFICLTALLMFLPASGVFAQPQEQEQIPIWCQVRMNLDLKPTNPSTVLALGDRIRLTDTQRRQVQSILDEAEKETAALLTEEQKEQLQPLQDEMGKTPGMMRGCPMMKGKKMMKRGRGEGRQ